MPHAPFSNPYRSHRIGELPSVARVFYDTLRGSPTNAPGDLARCQVRIAGWVARKRAFGALLFLELRDETGTLQAVLERGTDAFDVAVGLREESVVSVAGQLVERAVENQKHALATGRWELVVEMLTVLSRAAPLPFAIHS
jgi:aspartyl-tRNA synthetase